MDFSGLTARAPVCRDVDGEIRGQGPTHVPGVPRVPMCFHPESLHNPFTSLGTPGVLCNVSPVLNQECRRPHVRPLLRSPISTGGGGGCVHPSKWASWAGSNCETCHTGCTRRIPSCSRRTKDAGPATPMILNGPRYLSANFHKGHVVRINSACRKTLSPMFKMGTGICAESADSWVCCCMTERFSRSLA